MNVPRSTTEKAQPVGFKSEPGLPFKLSLLRWKLHRKAKQEPAFRFYALYDRLYRRDVLETAYRLAKKNDGSPGVDQVSFTDIESCPGGSAGLIDLLQEELRNKSYKPSPVRRTYTEKENGKQRPLGIPCIRDRVVQTAAKLVLEPIFEADFFDKTTIIDLRQERASLDFLGFTLRYDQDLHGRPGRRYLNTFPSKKAVMKHREKLRGFTRSGYKRTLSDTIAKVNQANRGWKGYFEPGYPRQCFRGMNHFVLGRFKSFINHRSQRRCRPLRDGESLYAGLRRMGYEPL